VHLLLSRLRHQGSQQRPDTEKSVQDIADEFEADFMKRTDQKQREIEEKLKLDDIFAQIKALKDENDQLKADNRSLNDKIAEEKKKVDNANTLAVDSDSANQQEIARLQKENESLHADRDSKANQLREAENRATEAETQRDDLRQQLAALEKERDELKIQNKELGEAVTSLKELDTNKNTEAIRELERKLQEQQEQFEAQLKAAQDEIAENKKKADDSAQAVVSIKEQLLSAKDKEEVATKMEKEATKAAEEMATKIDNLEAQLEATKEFHEQAQSNIQKIQSEKTALEKQLQERKTESSDQVKTLEEKLESLTKELETVKKEAEEKKSALDAQRAKLVSDLSSRDEAVQAIKSQLEESQSKLKTVESERSSLQKKLDESESSFKESQSKSQQKLKALSELESKLETATKKLEKSAKEHASHVESSERQIQELQRKISELQSSSASEKKMIETHYIEQVSALKKQLESSGTKGGVSPLFIQQLARLQQDLRQFKTLTEDLKQKQVQFKNTEDMLEKLDEARVKALRNIEDSRLSRASLEATIKTMETALRAEKENASQWREQYLTAEDERQNAVAELRRAPTAQMKAPRPGLSQNIWFYLFLMLLVAVLAQLAMRYFKKHFQQIIYGW
jgi:chromosome segregation ATPase